MFCTKCGMKNGDDALFCAGCGSVMARPQSVQPVMNNQPAETVAAPEENVVPVMENITPVEEPVTPVESAATESTPVVENVTESTPVVENVVESAASAEEVSSIDENVTATQETPVENAAPKKVQLEKVEPQAQAGGEAQSFAQPQFNNQPPNNQQNFGQAQSFGQPQFNNQPPNNQQQNFGQTQRFNAAQNFGQAQFTQSQTAPQQGKKSSAKRIIFSIIAILASIVSCFGIMFTYTGLEYKMSMEGYSTSDKAYTKGYKIIKDKMNVSEDTLDMDGADDVQEAANTFRYIVIAFEIALIVFTIIDIILLTAVRKRIGYLFTMLFSVIKIGLGAFAIYLWSFDVLDELKKLFGVMVDEMASYADVTIKLSSTIGIGMMLSIILQVIVFVCSIVLMTCKNKKREMSGATNVY